MSPSITCPNCRHAFPLDETLAGPLIDAKRREFETQFAQQSASLNTRLAEFERQQAAALAERQRLLADRAALDAEVAERVAAQRKAIAAEEAARARQALHLDLAQRDAKLKELEQRSAEDQAKLAASLKAEAEARRVKREFEDKVREVDAELQRRLDAELAKARDAARTAASDEARLKLAEKDKVIDDMRRQVDDLKRKAEQGSQQLQGEVLELEIEALLRTRFPRDLIEPVPKGVHGGDTLHRVCAPNAAAGQPCGVILWESKRTANWSPAWLPKLRDDQRAAKADIAVIVSSALPKGVVHFDCVDGVWITSPACVVPVALALRQALVDIAAARQTGENQLTKMEMVYRYLTGPRFAHRVQAIVEKFTDMNEDLDKERKFMQKQWAKRQAQIESVIEATAGMYGDLQGIATGALPEIPGLDTRMLESNEPRP
jgi:hypothetical protein